MLVEFDPEVDAIRVRLTQRRDEHVRGKRLDDRRLVLFNDQDEPVSVEVLFVSQGIELDGLPQAAAIAAALRAFPRLAA
jgi:hypothetical protein